MAAGERTVVRNQISRYENARPCGHSLYSSRTKRHIDSHTLQKIRPKFNLVRGDPLADIVTMRTMFRTGHSSLVLSTRSRLYQASRQAMTPTCSPGSSTSRHCLEAISRRERGHCASICRHPRGWKRGPYKRGQVRIVVFEILPISWFYRYLTRIKLKKKKKHFILSQCHRYRGFEDSYRLALAQPTTLMALPPHALRCSPAMPRP